MVKFNKQEFMETIENKTKKKKILIDVAFLFDQYTKRGLGRYGIELIERLIKYAYEDSKYEVSLIGFLTIEQNLVQFGFTASQVEELKKLINFFSLGNAEISGIKNIKLWINKYIPYINFYKPDLYFVTNFERGMPTLPFINRKLIFKPKTVVTIHDVIPISTKKYSNKGFFQNLLKSFFYNFLINGIKKVDLIITVSNFSKKEIIKYKKIKEDKIKVIYQGVADQFFISKYKQDSDLTKEVMYEFGLLGSRYFFYDSGLEKTKGIDEMLLIFKKIVVLNKIGIPKKLVVTGGSLKPGIGQEIKPNDSLGEEFLKRATSLNILTNIIATGRISDEILRILLFSATAHIYLSQNEGFGFGPVQAMAAEVPSIAYNGSCLPEITSGGSLLVSLKDMDSTVKQIVHFLENDDLIQKTRAIGLEVAKRYNWENTARSTWQEFKNLLE